jgi:probable DNA repair protein
VQAWRELLEEFAALDPLIASLTLGEALGRLRRLAAERLFQPQSAEVPVQVLGVLETEGLAFDHLWVMGLHDELWPASPRPNPLLPVSVQRKHGLPHASAERELVFARRVTARLLASARRQVVLSSPRREGDRDLFPSPLILAYPETPCATVAGDRSPLYRESLQRSSSLERLADGTAPPLAEGEHVAGGSAVFRLQAACPFRAFAEVRLDAAPLEEPAVGLDARERGILLHKALELLWQRLRDRERLHAMPEQALGESVARAVDAALAAMKRRRPRTFTPRFTLLERERLIRLIAEWLALEKARAPFVALGHETRGRFAIGGIEIDMAIDRMDVLEDGGLVVIDYKSGVPEVQDWFGDRPADPQLPLYTLYCEEGGRSVAAVAYAQVRRGDLAFKGLARDAGILPGVPEFTGSEAAQGRGAWGDLLQGWKAVLVGLARRFRAGAAEVDPRDTQVCRHCHLHSLCRVYELEARLGRLDVEAA